MNLAHVERYFADVLSGMESMHDCVPNLHIEDGYWRRVPGMTERIPYPNNLFIVGTVNVDETTYMFSPKVLDRANTFEFRVNTADLSENARKPTKCETGDPSLIKGLLAIAEDDNWHLENPASGLNTFIEHLRGLHKLLAGDGFEFGHRVFYEAVRFAAMYSAAGDDDPEHALDLQIMQKVLPRLHGSRRRIEPILCALGQFCFNLKVDTDPGGTEDGSRFDPLAPPEGEARLAISTRKAELIIKDAEGRLWGKFIVELRRKTAEDSIPPPLLDLRNDQDRDTSLEPVRILEGQEYLYKIKLEGKDTASITTDKEEILDCDTDKGDCGRLRPGLHTGGLPIAIFADGQKIGQVALEVRSRKLDYLSHYRWMLRDIAEDFSEVVMERFAPTEQRFDLDYTSDAKTLYQRFAFLKNLIGGDAFEAAMQQIIAKPHRAWISEEEFRRPGQGIPPTSAIASQLAKSGARIICDQHNILAPIPSLPEKFLISRSTETLDTPENRFVKFALSLWRSIVSDIGLALERAKPNFPITRGLREIKETKDLIDSLLSNDLFRGVGRLTQFPASSQVLQKREGYRDLFRSYIQFEAAALLAWSGGEDVYGAGQRDVATLYEFWVFFQLAKIISKLCDEPFDWESLLAISPDGLTIKLRRGEYKVLSGTVSRLGRRLRLELWFNRTFGTRSDSPLSWSRPMRPDCSLLIRSDEQCQALFEKIWLHFDAKYRVEALDSLFGRKGTSEEEEFEVVEDEETAEHEGRSERADLLKMHAYKDAIRRSAGSYVIYPGSTEEKLRQYYEILPGIGAFALRPTYSGYAEGSSYLLQFIEDILDHVASHVTQHERWRYWTKETFNERYRVKEHVRAAPFLKRPPADTVVLLGYVKNMDHHQWIRENGRYNLRADKRRGSVGLRSAELAAELVCLYGPEMDEIQLWHVVGEPAIATQARMIEMGYPNPTGELYYCLPLKDLPMLDWQVELTKKKVKAVRARVAPETLPGAPVTVTWLELVR
jgi:predicted component of viral defense system (DUF524 family)